MKASELRIGNIVQNLTINENASPFTEWVENIVDIEILNIINENTDYKPIQLTNDWMKKFGFKLDSISSEFYGHNMIFHSHLVHRQYISWGTVRLQYVHQLQNLYFALTGEELTIK